MESMSYLADVVDPDLSFVVDYPNNLIYLSAATYDSAVAITNQLTYKRFIRRFDLDLVPDGSIKFYITLTTTTADIANVHFVSDLAYNETHLFETFSFESNKLYFVSYLR